MFLYLIPVVPCSCTYTTMIRFLWIITIIIIQSNIPPSSSSSSSSSCQHHHIHHHTNNKFEQKTTIFWEFNEESSTWVQVKSPYDLISCVNDTNCTKVGIIEPIELDQEQESINDGGQKKVKKDEKKIGGLSSIKRISLIKMSEDSIWVTGVSGSIYERFWNGVQWVIAPHELHVQAGYAVALFLVNHTILALSEVGILYQMQLSKNSQPMWVEFTPIIDSTSTTVLIKSGVISHDRERIYFCTKNGLLLELSEAEPPRWINHGKPPGAVVAAIVDAAGIRPQVIFTISLSGDLYEFDRTSKPLWKKHVWGKQSGQDTTLKPSTGSTAHRRTGPHSDSLYLLTKGGNLVERKLHQRKWKWLLHGSPKNQHLTSITLVTPDINTYTNSFSLFLTTASGSVFEYNISKQQDVDEKWVNHIHPPHTKVAKGISGLNYQPGRIVFPLDDGRLAELHQSKTGGDVAGPTSNLNTRRRVSNKYTWSIIDAPESEGWNAEYCTEDRGPLNCISGVKDHHILSKRHEHYQYYQTTPGKSKDESNLPLENSVNTNGNRNFRLRVMHEGRSFFLVTDYGKIYEYLNIENVWFWLHHGYHTDIKGAVGNYNGSLFLVDENNDLIMRERGDNELTWTNCTAVKKGWKVTGGPPWNLPTRKVTSEDSLFFVSKSGRLLQLTVALRKLKWKDCRNPMNVKIGGIIDQETFRENIVFVVGTDGRLYQYNKVTGLWHGHHQSQHMVLSRQPGTAMRGTAMRPWSKSLAGSLFMISEDGRLVEYQWNQVDGWGWVEHGTPGLAVTLVGSTGPCVGGTHLFLIGSNGNVYLRHLDLDQQTWKWTDCGFPNLDNENETDCDSKVMATRPIQFTENSVVFELGDGRLAEMQRTEDLNWVWQRTIGTPVSRCNVIHWTAVVS